MINYPRDYEVTDLHNLKGADLESGQHVYEMSETTSKISKSLQIQILQRTTISALQEDNSYKIEREGLREELE